MVYVIVPLLSCLAYTGLLVITARHRPVRPAHLAFMLYLLAVALWAGIMSVIYAGILPDRSALLSGAVLLSAFLALSAYNHFLCAFLDKPRDVGVIAGYAGVAAMALLVMRGDVSYIVKGSPVAGATNVEMGTFGIAVVSVAALALIVRAVFMVLSRYTQSTDPLFRNRIAYLVTGFSFMALLGLPKLYPATTQYPVAHLGNLFNAFFIAYAIARYQLLDIRIFVRRGLAFALATVFFAVVYVGILRAVLLSLHLPARNATMLAATGVALLLAVLFSSVRADIQKWAEQLIFKGAYDHRQMLLTFADRMSNVLDLDELAQYMLSLINNGIHAREAVLYLPDADSGDFVPRFSMPATGTQGDRMTLGKDNPIVTWLAKENSPLSREQVDIIPHFKSLWQKERDQLAESGMQVFVPVKNKGALIGIVALGRKNHDLAYHSEDLSLVMTMAMQAGVVMENAQLYARAKMRASVDELTGLYNHRYFQERLQEEIARGFRFGSIFSLILLDLDLFKQYNDTHGHLAGDRILKLTGEVLKRSTRTVDMAFRYGGDEFAAILPGASLNEAQGAAERVRQSLERAMTDQGALVTCSLGIASWPTSRTMREGLIQCADLALYQAKHWGNRCCVYNDGMYPDISQLQSSQPERQGVISTIYALASAVDARDHSTYGHSRVVSNCSVAIGEAIGLPPEKIAILRAAALLHDIGKIGIPDEVLKRAGPLNEEDWKPIHSHPTLGVSIIKHIGGLAACLPGVQYHHEHYDGTGYPDGLKDGNIPLDARIIAIADAYDAMTSPRPYRLKPLTHEEALEQLRLNIGTEFDPELVKVFATLSVAALRKAEAVPADIESV